MDDVEILEIEEEKTNVLIEQAETRKKLLKLANEAMDLQKINIDSYTNSTYQLNKMKEAYIQLRKKNQELEKEF